jgi:E3 ubiquitin-protein ligase DOA10
MKPFFLALLISSSVYVHAQTESASPKIPGRTAFYAELGGRGYCFQPILIHVLSLLLWVGFQGRAWVS